MTERPTRTAIVTGAGKRVGRAIAQALLADGWAVVAHVHHRGDGVPDGAIAVVADLMEEEATAAIFAAAAGLPPVALLVNNAARFTEDRLDTMSRPGFDSHMAVNVRAPAMLTQMFAERVGDSGGLVVNLLDAKLSALNADFLSYTLSKIALAGLTQLSARALAGQGIRVNAIAPALMLQSEGQDESNFEAMHRFNPLGRGVEPADVVAALRYLIGASAMTGETLTLDGGQRFWALPRDVQYLERE